MEQAYIAISMLINERMGEPSHNIRILQMIREFQHRYPATYKVAYLRLKFMDKLDNLERIDGISKI